MAAESLKKQHNLYFAYGANTNIEDMRYRCPNAEPIGIITLPNYELVFRSVADIQFSMGKSVTGVLWAITQDCEWALDIFEGYPRFYTKNYFDIKYRKKIEQVMFYTMTDTSETAPPNSYYESCLRAGYSHWKINQSQLDSAIDLAKS